MVAMLLTSCSDNNDDGVRIDPPADGFTFKPTPGGALMHYSIPDNDQITGLQVTYRDENGQNVRCTGSATSDSLQLIGFNHAQTDVEAQVRYIMRDQSKSAPIGVTFSTLNSAPVEFLNSVDVTANWKGFSLKFENNAESKGMVHVFYLGVDPLSNQPDTILMNSFYLEKGNEVQIKNYRMQQNVGDKVNVVVRAEDFLGNMVGEKTWNDIALLEEQKATWNNDYSFFCDNIITDGVSKTGLDYLFDGDLTGVSQTQKENFYDIPYNRYSKLCTFVAGPDAYGDGTHPWYVDMKSDHVMANVRLYAMLKWANYATGQMVDLWGSAPGNVAGYYISTYWENKTPCDVTLYGMKDNGKSPASFNDLNTMDGEWVKIGTFSQDADEAPKNRYCPDVGNINMTGGFGSYEEMRAAAPEFLEVSVPAAGQGSGYRYLKIVINNTFSLSGTWGSDPQVNNRNKYVVCQELEIYTSKK